MDLVGWLADLVAPTMRVAVDGPDAAGKTTLADALAARVGAARVSADGYLRPPQRRYRLGRYSAEGCYRDSHDHAALRAAVLSQRCPVICDGVFLQRPELRNLWDLTIYLDVDAETTLARARIRDAAALGGVEEVERRYRRRYLPAQEIYRRDVDPAARADVVLRATRFPPAPG